MDEVSKMTNLEALHIETGTMNDGGQRCSSKHTEDKTEKSLKETVAKRIKYLNIGKCPAPGTVP